MRKVLIVGASGATGKLLVQQFLQKDIEVIAIVRTSNSFTRGFDDQTKLQIVEASISEMSDNELAPHLRECDTVLSCLGHNLTFKGLFGKPRRLVTEAIEKISRTIEYIAPERKIKIILMNTTGNSNRDIPEKPPLSQRSVISILRLFLPPHMDNEQAADFLRLCIGHKHKCIEWAAVRPDSLIDEDRVTEYDIHPSPIRNAIFDSAPTSRINVANFMSTLALNAELWDEWKGKMPVIYNHIA